MNLDIGASIYDTELLSLNLASSSFLFYSMYSNNAYFGNSMNEVELKRLFDFQKIRVKQRKNAINFNPAFINLKIIYWACCWNSKKIWQMVYSKSNAWAFSVCEEVTINKGLASANFDRIFRLFKHFTSIRFGFGTNYFVLIYIK